MTSILRDMFRHQEWADAELWTALAGHPPARDDEALRRRLHHLHQVQRAFVWTVGGRVAQFVVTKPEDFGSFDALRDYARESLDEFRLLVDSLSDRQLEAPVSIVWFNDPPLTLKVGEALAQAVMHSQWHRGQNAARLRELGGEPPMIDLIVWYWKGKPAAAW